MRFLISLLLLSVLLSSPVNAGGNLRTIAQAGESAVGFPTDYTYRHLNEPFIGRVGHIAFSGAADLNPGTRLSSRYAVWHGKPGQLSIAIKSFESPEGFPANVVFNSAASQSLVLTGSGNLAFAAYMGGARTGRAYLATVNGVTHGIIQQGNAALGFPPGSKISYLEGFFFTDAGMAFQGRIDQSHSGIWFWNNSTIELVLAEGAEFSPLYPGCRLNSLSLMDMNQEGELLFQATLQHIKPTICPDSGLFTWKANIFRQVFVEGQQAPGTPPDASFSYASTFIHASINDNGDVSFRSRVEDTAHTTHYGYWIAYANGDIVSVSLAGETLPNSPTETLSSFDASTANVTHTTMLNAVASTGASMILVGSPRQSTDYPYFNNPGESQLDVLVRSDQPPPGFAPSWYLERIDQTLINNQDTVALWVQAKDATSTISHPRTLTQIWAGNDNASLRLLAMDGEPVLVDGTAVQLYSISYPWELTNTLRGSNSGQPNQFSDLGQLVFRASLGETRQDILLLGMAATPKCSGLAVGIPARTYADGEIIYCVGDESLTTVANETVRVSSGADVVYESPALYLNRGFSVATGGRFSAVSP